MKELVPFVISGIIFPLGIVFFYWFKKFRSRLEVGLLGVYISDKQFNTLLLMWIFQSFLAITSLIFLFFFKLAIGFFILPAYLSIIIVFFTSFIIEVSLSNEKRLDEVYVVKIKKLLSTSFNASKLIIVLYILVLTWKVFHLKHWV